MRRAIVCTGLIRNPEKFNAFLDAIASLDASARADLTVLFSTWVNELDAYPEIRQRFRALSCIIIEQGAPDLTLSGHALHQLTSLGSAIDLLDDETFVLKFRPDIGQVRDVGIFFRSQPVPVSEASPFASLVRYRFQYRGAFGAHPLYINDVTYCGMASDIRQLVNLPFSFLVKFAGLAAEQLYWGAPFTSKLAVLEAYFRVNVGLIFNNIENSESLRRMLVQSPVYARALAVHVMMMRDCFVYFDAEENEDAFLRSLANHTLEEILWHPNLGESIRYHPAAHTNYFHSPGIWQVVAKGRFKMSPFGDLFLSAMAAYDRADGLAVMNAQRMMLLGEAADLGDRLQAALPTGPLRQIRRSEDGYRIQSRQPEWSLVRGNSDHIDRMENENHTLRRHIDQLNRRIQDLTNDQHA